MKKFLVLFVIFFAISMFWTVITGAQEIACDIQVSDPIYDASRPLEARVPIVITIHSDIIANDPYTRPGRYEISSKREKISYSGDLFNGVNYSDPHRFYPFASNGKTLYTVDVLVDFLDGSQVTCSETFELRPQR